MGPLTPDTMDHKAIKKEVLREIRESFQALAENANDGILIAASGGAHIYANRRASEITGYTVAELLKTSIMDLAAPDEVKNLMERFRKRLSGEDIPHQYETLIIRKDGKSVPVEFTAAKTVWHGQPAVLVIFGDITERKRAEEALKKARQELRFIIDSVPALIWQKDTDGRYVQVNKRYCDTVGLSVEDVLGRTDPELYPDKIATKYMQDDREVMASRTDRHGIEEQHTRPFGDAGWSLTDKMVWYDSERNVKGTIGFAVDITRRKRAEESLQESKEFLNKIINSLSDPIHVKDRQHRVILINDAACRLFDKSREEILGKTAYELFFEKEMADISWQKDEEVFRTGKESVNVETNTYAPGKTLTVLVKKTLYTDTAKNQFLVGITMDITKRKRMEDSLRESEAKFRLIAENTADNIWIFDMDLHLKYISPSVKKMKGFTVEETLSQSLEEMMTPASLESLMKRFNQEMVLEASGTADPDRTVSFETEEYCKYGETILVENSVSFIRDAQDRPVLMLGVSRDITERKQMENALRESEETFRALAENANDGILVAVAGGAHAYANRRASEITGYSIAELLKTSIMDLVVPKESEKITERFREILQDKPGSSQHETAIISREKMMVPIEFTSAKTVWHGQPAVLVVIRDITERKRIEEVLCESEERYRIVTDAAHDAIFTLSTDGVVTFVNSGGSALIGIPPEKIAGLSLENLYHPDIAQQLRENLDTVISTKSPVRFDAKFWRENPDQVTWLDAQLVPQFGPDGSVLQVIGISRSITDRKQAEILLKRFNQELESQVRSRTMDLERLNTLLEAEVIQRTMAEDIIRNSLNERELLLREIHHRVKNNLQIILSLISLQSRNIKDPSLQETMGEFQNRIMAMAHVHERMCFTDDIGRIDLSEIVTFLGTNLFRSFNVDPQCIRLDVKIKDLQITIDSAIPLSLIISELLSNAIKHAFPKGTPGEITITGRRESDALVLSIRDTGKGIPKDLDWRRNKQSLGLRLVVSLVEQMQGTIELDRTSGTTFTIIIKEKK